MSAVSARVATVPPQVIGIELPMRVARLCSCASFIDPHYEDSRLGLPLACWSSESAAIR